MYSKNGNTAYTQHASNAYGSEATAQTSKGGYAGATSTAYGNTAAGKTSSGDMYADHNGNVYKNTGSGWQKYDNGSWNTVNKSTAQASAQSYEQSHPNATSDAQNRTQSYDQSHPSGSSGYTKPSSGSYGDLDQAAQNRARGDTQSHNFSQYQHSGGFGGGSRSWGGGGDHWGGGGGFRR